MLYNLQEDCDLPWNQPESRTCKTLILFLFLAVLWTLFRCFFHRFHRIVISGKISDLIPHDTRKDTRYSVHSNSYMNNKTVQSLLVTNLIITFDECSHYLAIRLGPEGLHIRQQARSLFERGAAHGQTSKGEDIRRQVLLTGVYNIYI